MLVLFFFIKLCVMYFLFIFLLRHFGLLLSTFPLSYIAGSILVGAGYQGGVVKVFYLTVDLQWSSQVTLTANLATELNVFGKTGECS